jgi:hypothetical protein
MKLVGWMAAAAALVAALAAAVWPAFAGEIVLGMCGPLVETAATWTLTDVVYRRRPERLTKVMVAAFAAKLVFFGAYVTVMVTVLDVRPVPFMASFTTFFIALHFAEALALRRLFAGARGN